MLAKVKLVEERAQSWVTKYHPCRRARGGGRSAGQSKDRLERLREIQISRAVFLSGRAGVAATIRRGGPWEDYVGDEREREDYAKMQGTHTLYASRGRGTRLWEDTQGRGGRGRLLFGSGLRGQLKKNVWSPEWAERQVRQ